MTPKTFTAKLIATIMTLVIFASFFSQIPASANQYKPNSSMTEIIDDGFQEDFTSPLYKQRYEQYCNLRNTSKSVYICNSGAYHATNVKLYGRKIIRVEQDGSFTLGAWELLNPITSFNGLLINDVRFDISGTYVAFAFSFDITWGTDFPFSDIFWDDIYNTDWDFINIEMDGMCRTANIRIDVGLYGRIHVQNLQAHKEWTP